MNRFRQEYLNMKSSFALELEAEAETIVDDAPPLPPEPETPVPEPPPEPLPALPAQTVPQQDPFTHTFEALYHLIGKYLACSDHQRTILALWIVHTYCLEVFPVTPYLYVYSPEKQSGKTVCMRLLRLLANNSWMPAGGLTATRLMEQIAQRRPTVLLDDWHTIFRPREAQSIIGFLNASSAEETRYSGVGAEDKDIYCPKAFAGPVGLPSLLAGHSIPIRLQRRKPNQYALPCYSSVVRIESAPLVEQIREWIHDKENYRTLYRHASELFGSDLPEFSPRQRECAFPLLSIARMLGGKWYRRAHLALLRVFDIYAGPDLSFGLQLLQDIRVFFITTGRPKVFTAELVPYLTDLTYRPWSRDRKRTPIHPLNLGYHLRQFGVCSTYNH